MAIVKNQSVDIAVLPETSWLRLSTGGKAVTILMRTLFAMLMSLALVLPAAAAPMLDYKLTPLSGGSVNASWQLAQNPTPDGVFSPLDQFSFSNVSFNVNGMPEVHNLYFFEAGGVSKGGFCIGNCSTSAVILLQNNIQLFSGPLDTPTMLTGTFFFSEFVTNFRYQLDVTVAPPDGVVPEPGSLAMLVAGLGILGAMRRRAARRMA